MSERIKIVRNLAGGVLCNKIFQVIIAFIFSLPLIATLGQYVYSGFIKQNCSVIILFWPGIKGEFRVNMPVMISFGLMALSYVAGIVYMFRKGTLGKVAVLGFAGIILAQSLGGLVNSFTGLREMQQSDSSSLNGVVNRAIFSLWHNPVWEEVVFRGIPFVILITLKRKLPPKGFKIALTTYLIIPSIAMVFYHVPNHGMSRIVDTLVLSVIFAWLTIKYSFFAPLVLHYIFDSMMIINLGTMKGINKTEVEWLSSNAGVLNTSFSFGILALFLSLPIIFIWNFRRKNISAL